MSLLNGALQIGQSALLSTQSALQIVGNNVANAGNAAYTRQSPLLTGLTGAPISEGFLPGGGVSLSGLQRNVDESLDNRLRIALGNEGSALIQQQALGRIEAVVNELSDTDLSTLLQTFFSSFATLQNNPQDEGARGMVLANGDALVAEIQRQRADILGLRDELNEQLVSQTEEASDLARQIADLNVRITSIETPESGGASALRDQRDQLLQQLGELVEIQVREQPDGGVNVYVGNELFVTGGFSRGLTTTLETIDNHPRTVVRFADNNREVNLVGGAMAGTVEARDTHVLGYIDSLNNLSQALINEVNKVHSSGQGYSGYETLTGAFEVLDADAALNSSDTGLGLVPQNGSFLVYVTNTQTEPVTREATAISVDLDGIGTDDSLTSLAAKLDAVEHLNAEVTADNRLKLTADGGFELTFGEDTSYALAALGVNVFFSGNDAESLGINADLTSNLNLLAAATNHEQGDGSNAGALAALATESLTGLGQQSLTDFYNSLAAEVAVRGAAASASLEASNSVVVSLQAQRESLCGVSLDEETISMMRFERVFQAAARYTTVVDELMADLMSLVG